MPSQGAYGVLTIVSQDIVVSPYSSSTSKFKLSMNSIWFLLSTLNDFQCKKTKNFGVCWCNGIKAYDMEWILTIIYRGWGVVIEETPQNATCFIKRQPFRSHANRPPHHLSEISKDLAVRASRSSGRFIWPIFHFYFTLNINISFIQNRFCDSKYTTIIYSMNNTS